MITDKALYWMAVGLVALAAGNHLVSRLDGRCLGERTMAVVEHLSGGPAFAAILDNSSVRCARAQASIEKAQARMAATQVRFAAMQGRFASAQTMVARHQAAFARLQAETDRLAALHEVQQMRLEIAAPHQNLRLAIPQIAVPSVHVSVNGDNL